MSHVQSLSSGQASNQVHTMDPIQVKKNRLKLIGIFAVAVLPVIFAFVMYFGGVAIPQSKTNKGNLIWPPVPLSLLGSGAGSAEALAIEEQVLASEKWTLMVTGGGACDASCDELLHTVRQVNVAMGKEMERVTRALVSALPAQELNSIGQRYPEMPTYLVEADSLDKFLLSAAENGARQQGLSGQSWEVWLVDPLGNVIMQYEDSHNGYDMIDDLKRVLKLSNIG